MACTLEIGHKKTTQTVVKETNSLSGFKDFTLKSLKSFLFFGAKTQAQHHREYPGALLIGTKIGQC